MNNEFWNYVLSMAESLEQTQGTSIDKIQALTVLMESIDILYHKQFDPADNYEEYVTATLCHAVYKALATA